MDIYMAMQAIIADLQLDLTPAERDQLWSILNAYGEERYEDGRSSCYY